MGVITAFLIQYVIPFLMVFFTITVMFVFFPRMKVKTSYAFTGAFFLPSSLRWQNTFSRGMSGTVVKFGTIYGPLTAFVVFLLWVFYSACIFLIGAEMVHNLIIYKNRR